MATYPSTRQPSAQARGWAVVLPVKGGADAKSRLEHPARAELARAFALDAVTAVLACEAVAQVVVVTADAAVAREHTVLGAHVVTDPGTGLVDALRAGASAAPAHQPCALLLADLPALRPEDLGTALAACRALLNDGAAQVVVPDADGTGTVLLAAARPDRLRPAFGSGSAVAHAETAHVLTDVSDRLRRDVDTDAHLEAAVALGVGERTAAVLRQPRSTIAPSAASFSPKCS
jgi:2-phospho-L-lactate guanylyltransferase